MQLILFTDSPLIAAGFTACVSPLQGYEIVAVVSNAQDLFRAVEQMTPDLVIFDFSPDGHLQTLAALRERAPQQKILLWAYSISVETAYSAMRLGIRGVLQKTDSLELIAKCLDKLGAGEVWFGQELTRGFLSAKAINLTPRESELVLLVAHGLKNKEIATCLSLSVATVRIYLSTLFHKLGVKDRYELAIYGLKNFVTAGTRLETSAEGSLPTSLPRYGSVVVLDGKHMAAQPVEMPKVRPSHRLGVFEQGRLARM